MTETGQETRNQTAPNQSAANQSEARETGLTGAAAALAYAGALPLILLAVIIWARPPEDNNIIRELTIVYGGLLLAFFGGVRWGIAALRVTGPDFRSLAGAVAPLVLAMPVFLMTFDTLRLGILVVALPVLLIDDLMATTKGSGAPGWYRAVRVPLTIMLEVALLAVLIRVLLF